MQSIGEVVLDVPEGWQNQSVNVFTAQSPGSAGMSITINRDTLGLGVEFEDYVNTQSAKIADQLKGFKALGRQSLDLDGRHAVELEFSWQTDDVGSIHQILVTVSEGRKVLNLAASLGGRMNKTQADMARRVLHSLRFAQPDQPATASPD